MIRVLSVCVLALALTGCASVGQQAPADTATLSGKLSVRVDATSTTPSRSESGNFELKGTPEAGQLNLSTPLGTVMAQARWAGQRAWLATSQGETAYPNLDSLTQEMLGESLPVAALFDWLRGRPWPGTAHRTTPSGFDQLGWSVDLARFSEGWVSAKRAQAPAVLVRAKVDAP